ncbi:glucose 1-dehydrogenase [Parahaliea maris]|uniref:Glucose 1-dehydrogenase n=1 Tax=Parahaliea maris TaxID=2716870 RepID=A0A5C9A9X9_9GAMM|nr:glucose 1-dehydrogenase [Parahaliea maris]TXS96460.1 glucose 1-dehydrogenase [Parahaliea maris]
MPEREAQHVGCRKVAIVTGAARGIGRSIAAKLIEAGCKLVITDLDREEGIKAARALEADFFAHDVADEDSWRSLMSHVSSSYGRLDVLVNNAGIYRSGSIEDVSLEDWMVLQSVNVAGVFLGCKFAIPLMKACGGVIINMSSGAALRPNSGAALYSASKSAVWNLTRTTALHCAEQGYNIRCNSIHPGMVDTEMVASMAVGEEALRELYTKGAALHPLRRMASVEDIAAVAAFLATDSAEYLTGVALPVDGGYAIN